jgi:hypothetical protein
MRALRLAVTGMLALTASVAGARRSAGVEHEASHCSARYRQSVACLRVGLASGAPRN